MLTFNISTRSIYKSIGCCFFLSLLPLLCPAAEEVSPLYPIRVYSTDGYRYCSLGLIEEITCKLFQKIKESNLSTTEKKYQRSMAKDFFSVMISPTKKTTDLSKKTFFSRLKTFSLRFRQLPSVSNYLKNIDVDKTSFKKKRHYMLLKLPEELLTWAAISNFMLKNDFATDQLPHHLSCPLVFPAADSDTIYKLGAHIGTSETENVRYLPVTLDCFSSVRNQNGQSEEKNEGTVHQLLVFVPADVAQAAKGSSTLDMVTITANLASNASGEYLLENFSVPIHSLEPALHKKASYRDYERNDSGIGEDIDEAEQEDSFKMETLKDSLPEISDQSGFLEKLAEEQIIDWHDNIPKLLNTHLQPVGSASLKVYIMSVDFDKHCATFNNLARAQNQSVQPLPQKSQPPLDEQVHIDAN